MKERYGTDNAFKSETIKARIAEEGDNELKETEIMAKKGYFKVYDCGNLIYKKKF